MTKKSEFYENRRVSRRIGKAGGRLKVQNSGLAGVKFMTDASYSETTPASAPDTGDPLLGALSHPRRSEHASAQKNQNYGILSNFTKTEGATIDSVDKSAPSRVLAAITGCGFPVPTI